MTKQYLPASLALTVILAGCGTSSEVRELAIETAAAIQTLDVAISRNADFSKKNADQAASRIRVLLRSTAELQADLQAEIDASQSKSEFQKLKDFAEAQEVNRQKNLTAADAAAKAAADARQQWKSPSAQLRQMSDSLTALSKEESILERLKFTGKFVKEVADQVKKASEVTEDESKAAKNAAETKTAEYEAKATKNAVEVK